jgi:hypothetical protein
VAQEHFSHPEPPASPGMKDVALVVGHEERDVHALPILFSVFGLTLVCVAAVAAMFVLFNVFAAQQARNTTVPSPLAAEYGLKEPPEPRLQTDPLLDLQKLRARDAERLSTYAWVDRDAGVVQLPIERAIELLAARGLPAREAKP